MPTQARIAAALASAIPIQLVMPQAVLQPGQRYGPFVSPPLGAAYAAWVIQAVPISWPVQGDVMLIDTEYSADGVNWEHEGTGSWGPFNPVTGMWHTVYRGPLLATDFLRFTFTPLQVCAATFTLGGIPKAQAIP